MLEYVASYLHLEEWPLHHIMQSIELWLFFPQYCCISLKVVCLFLQILAIGYLSCKITMKMKVSIFCSSFTSILKYLCRIKSSFVKVAQSCQTLCNPMDCLPPGSSVHESSSGKNNGVGCHAFLQGIFPTQGSNPGLLHCRQIFYHLSHHGSPRILEWIAYPFPRGSSQPRNWTGVSCTAGRFFTSWATRKAQKGDNTGII